jgi:hypothetical protein
MLVLRRLRAVVFVSLLVLHSWHMNLGVVGTGGAMAKCTNDSEREMIRGEEAENYRADTEERILR